MGSIYVEVEVDLADVWNKVTDEQFNKEASSRSVRISSVEAVSDAINQIRRGETANAITTLEREFFPKWGSPESASAALAKARAGV